MLSMFTVWLGLIIVLFACDASANMHCQKCTSEIDENCAEGNHPTSECLPDEDRCYTRLVGGHVVRGCLLDLTPDDYYGCLNDGTCKSCAGSACNNVFWPKCHQCNGDDAGCDDEQLSAPEFCGQTSRLNFCYARLHNGQVTRGCGFEDPLCTFEPESCQICYNDGCNGLSKPALKPTKCQSCSASTEECIAGNASKLSRDCSRLADSCITAITSIASSARVIRECSELIVARIRTCANSLAAHPLCMSCQGNHCNDKRWLRCHQCKVTNLDSSCREEQVDLAMFCTSYRENDQCYTRVFNGFFERGCLSDLGANVNVCSEPGAKNCQLCDGQACNRNTAAIIVIINYSTLLFGLILAIYGLFS